MRPIKFKAWDAANSRMVENEFYIDQKTGLCCYFFNGELTDCGEEEPTLLQFTGVKDFLGDDVYEGDILKCSDESKTSTHIVEVKWDDEWCCFVITGKRGKKRFPEDTDYTKDTLNKTWSNYIERIGNIYENPELLPE